MVQEFEVLIIGAGVAGLGSALTLCRNDITDFVILEQADELGGTWRDNTYPGCACDSPSGVYSYSFAPNSEWTRSFAGQQEMLDYLRGTAERYRIVERIQLSTHVTAARWNSSSLCWELETSRGRYRARVLIAGTGPWHEPLIPALPGMSGFPGRIFHSARWDHDISLTGKRVAVVGTGASSIQFVPEIQPTVGELHLYQRTPPWVLPKPDRRVSSIERWILRRVPGAGIVPRALAYAGMEALGFGVRHPWALYLAQQFGRLHLRKAVKDPALRRALTPSYTMGCKRPLMSNTYYRALAHPKVTVHRAARGIEGDLVVDADGSRTPVDVIIFATGFHMLVTPIAHVIFDDEGRSLADHWQGSPQAYRGTMVSGFPNLFLLLGPGLGGHSSAFSIVEAQMSYIAAAIRRVRADEQASVEVRSEAQETYNVMLQHALAGTVYNTGGCSSHYHDADGVNRFTWAWSTFSMKRRISTFEPHDHLVRTAEGSHR